MNVNSPSRKGITKNISVSRQVRRLPTSLWTYVATWLDAYSHMELSFVSYGWWQISQRSESWGHIDLGTSKREWRLFLHRYPDVLSRVSSLSFVVPPYFETPAIYTSFVGSPDILVAPPIVSVLLKDLIKWTTPRVCESSNKSANDNDSNDNDNDNNDNNDNANNNNNRNICSTQKLELTLQCAFSDTNLVSLCTHFSRVRHLVLKARSIHPKGIQECLDRCEHLEFLHVTCITSTTMGRSDEIERVSLRSKSLTALVLNTNIPLLLQFECEMSSLERLELDGQIRLPTQHTRWLQLVPKLFRLIYRNIEFPCLLWYKAVMAHPPLKWIQLASGSSFVHITESEEKDTEKKEALQSNVAHFIIHGKQCLTHLFYNTYPFLTHLRISCMLLEGYAMLLSALANSDLHRLLCIQFELIGLFPRKKKEYPLPFASSSPSSSSSSITKTTETVVWIVDGRHWIVLNHNVSQGELLHVLSSFSDKEEKKTEPPTSLRYSLSIPTDMERLVSRGCLVEFRQGSSRDTYPYYSKTPCRTTDLCYCRSHTSV